MILNIVESITELSVPKINTANIDKLVKSYKNLNIEQAVAKMRTDGVAEAEIRATLAAQHYAEVDIQQAMTTRATNVAKTQNITLTKLQTAWQYALATSAKVANIALTAGLGILVSMIASKFISWLTNATEKQRNLADAAHDAKNNFDSLYESINTKKVVVNELAEEYAKLAQDVDQLTGENVSLSTEDYERFLELSNRLGEQFPELTRKFDDNGNAILNLTGNVDGIVGSLNGLIKAQQDIANQEFTSNMGTIYEDYYEKTRELKEKIEKENNKQLSLEEAKETLINSPRAFTMTQNAERVKLENAAATFGLDYTTKEVETKDGILGFTVDIEGLTFYEDVVEKYDDLYHQSISDLSAYKSQLSAEENEINRYIVACLQPDLDTFDFGENDSVLKAGIEELFSSFDPENLPDNIDASNWNDVYSYLRRIYLYPISQLEEDIQKQLVDVFSKPQDISNTEYINTVAEVQKYFNENHIDINLDFVVKDEKDLEKRLDNAISKITTGDKMGSIKLGDFIVDKEIDSYDEKEFFIDAASEAKSAEEAINLYNQAVRKIDKWTPIDPATLNESFGSIRTAYKTVSDAIDEYEAYNYLSLETVESLIQLDDEYLECLYDEKGQLTLNTEAYNKLTRAKLEEMKVVAINNALDTIESLKDEEEAAKYLKDTNIDLESVNWDLFTSNVALAESEFDLLSDTEAVEKRQQALDRIVASTKARIDLFNQAIGDVGKGGFYTGNSGDKGGEIDWIDQSIKVLENDVDNFREILEDTNGYDKQIIAIDNLNSALGRLNDGYKKSKKAYSNTYENELSKLSNSSTIRGYIESGTKFDLSKYDDKTAEIIKNAIEAYNNMVESEKKIKEIDEEISDNENIEKSKFKQQEYEYLLAGTQTLLENENLTQKEKENLLADQLTYQMAINEELAKQAEYEGNILEAENLRKKNKQLERDGISEKWKTKIDKNDSSINAQNALLQSSDLTEDDIDSINGTIEDLTETKYKNQFNELIERLDTDKLWTNYINKLKKKYGQEKTSTKKFAKEHIKEIVEQFSDYGMEELYYEFINSINGFTDTEYENHKNTATYYTSNNSNQISNIESDIEQAGGRGTKEQYSDIKQLHDENLTYWTTLKEEADSYLESCTEGTAEWDKWNAAAQECQDKINACNQGIKDCEISILSLPLNDISDRLKTIQAELDEVTHKAETYNTYVNAANFVLDQQVKNEEIKKQTIQDEVDALQKANEARQANLSLQKAEYNLEKLKNQKTERVFVEGVGWQYQSNIDELKEAQEQVDQATYDKRIADLNEQLYVHDKEITRLNKIKDDWSDINTNAQGLVDLQKALNYDALFYNKVLSGDIGLIEELSGIINGLTLEQITLEDDQKDYQLLESTINGIIDDRELEKLSTEEAQAKILSTLQTSYPELYAKYSIETTKIQDIIDKKKENADTTKTAANTINDAVNKSNEKILESYSTLKEDLAIVFEGLNSLVDSFSDNTSDMAKSVKKSIDGLKKKIGTLTDTDVTVTISSSDKDNKNLNDDLKSHSGMELGYIGESSITKDKKTFKYIALNDLKDNELIRILQKGEGVITSGQITQVMDNFRKIAQANISTTLPLKNLSQNKSISFNGDIIVNGVQNVDSLATAIKNQLPAIMLQELYK